MLAKWQDEKIYYPDYEEFCTQTDAAKYTFIYVLSVDEIQYFLAMRKGEVLEGSFQESFPMRKCMRNIKARLDGYDFWVSISSAVPYRNTGHLQRLRHIIYMAGTVTTVSAADAENRWYTIKRNAWCDACAATIWCSRKFVRR